MFQTLYPLVLSINRVFDLNSSVASISQIWKPRLREGKNSPKVLTEWWNETMKSFWLQNLLFKTLLHVLKEKDGTRTSEFTVFYSKSLVITRSMKHTPWSGDMAPNRGWVWPGSLLQFSLVKAMKSWTGACERIPLPYFTKLQAHAKQHKRPRLFHSMDKGDRIMAIFMEILKVTQPVRSQILGLWQDSPWLFSSLHAVPRPGDCGWARGPLRSQSTCWSSKTV